MRGTAILLCIVIQLSIVTSQVYAIAPGSIAPQTEQYRGSIVLLDFWASWCGSCEESLPWLNALASKVQNSKFRIITVNLDTDHARAQNLLDTIKPLFAVTFDPKGRLPEMFEITSMPSSYLIDAEGKILSVYSDASKETREKIESDIERALSGGTKW